MSKVNDELLDNSFTSEDYAKTLLSLQSASVTDGVKYLVNEMGFDKSLIPDITKHLSLVKGFGVSTAVTWDTSKSNEINGDRHL